MSNPRNLIETPGDYPQFSQALRGGEGYPVIETI